MKRFLLTTLSLAIAVPALAYERQHDSHEHGAAAMMLAVEGNEVQIRIDSPAANLIGFEYEPRTAEEKNKLKETIKQLRNADNALQLSGAAECHLHKASVLHTIGAEDAHDEHGHDEHDHDDHKHEEHGHDDHDDHKHEEHGHDDHEHEEDSHSDFIIEYHFDCGKVAALKEVNVKLFSQFPLLEELDLQYITPQGQGAAELTAKNPVFRF